MNKFQIKRFEYIITTLLQNGAAQWVALIDGNNEVLLTVTVYGSDDLTKKASANGWRIDEYLRTNPKHPCLVVVDFKTNELLGAYECKKTADNSLFTKIGGYYETATKIDLSGSRLLFPSLQRIIFWMFSAIVIAYFIRSIFNHYS